MSENQLKVLVLTPSYPGEGVQKADTPVVHYFVREWVKKGAEVRVVHYPVNFPTIVNMAAKPIRSFIEAKEGSEIRTWNLDEREFVIDGVKVKRIPLVKYLPHTRYGKRQISAALCKTINYLEQERFVPAVISSHWVNPQFEIMHHLKLHYGSKTCYIAHDQGSDLLTIYKHEAPEYISETNVIGYRSAPIKRLFETNFQCQSKQNFMCFSGIPSKYVESIERNIDNVNTFIHVATLLERKYPAVIVPAVYKAFEGEDFRISYIGTGKEEETIRAISQKLGVMDNIRLLGRVPREEVVSQMDNHSVFIMVSRDETFGLVYLEAMARGCITIASRDEGFDGIIEDGKNGFLCKAGDVEDLAKTLFKIKNMSKQEWQQISHAAIETAHSLTDEKVAEAYMENLKKTCWGG